LSKLFCTERYLWSSQWLELGGSGRETRSALARRQRFSARRTGLSSRFCLFG
jgi:hypothetical protein